MLRPPGPLKLQGFRIMRLRFRAVGLSEFFFGLSFKGVGRDEGFEFGLHDVDTQRLHVPL